MKLLTYNGRGVITDDRAARAVMHYAMELALVRRSDIVSVPALTEQGEAQKPVDMLIGPASQLLAESIDVSGDLDVTDFLRDVAGRMRDLHGSLEPFGEPDI